MNDYVMLIMNRHAQVVWNLDHTPTRCYNNQKKTKDLMETHHTPSDDVDGGWPATGDGHAKLTGCSTDRSFLLTDQLTFPMAALCRTELESCNHEKATHQVQVNKQLQYVSELQDR